MYFRFSSHEDKKFLVALDTGRWTGRLTNRQTDRQTDTHTHRHTHTHTHNVATPRKHAPVTNMMSTCTNIEILYAVIASVNSLR